MAAAAAAFSRSSWSVEQKPVVHWRARQPSCGHPVGIPCDQKSLPAAPLAAGNGLRRIRRNGKWRWPEFFASAGSPAAGPTRRARSSPRRRASTRPAPCSRSTAGWNCSKAPNAAARGSSRTTTTTSCVTTATRSPRCSACRPNNASSTSAPSASSCSPACAWPTW